MASIQENLEKQIYNQINPIMKAYHEPIVKASRAVAEITNYYNNYINTNREQVLATFNNISNIMNTFETVHKETIVRATRQMSDFFQTYNDVYNEKIINIIENMNRTMEMAFKGNIYQDINFDNIILNNNGTIEYEGTLFEKEEIEETTNELSKNIAISKEKKKSTLQKIILFILSAYICGIIGQAGAETYDYVKSKFVDTYRTIQDCENENTFFDEKCKIVDVGELNIREEGSINSRVIGKLYYLQLVKELDSVPYWTKIEYINEESNVKIIGWVSTKCIKSYNKLKQEFENIEE